MDISELTIQHAQLHQPWTVPYSSRFEDASEAIRLPYLPATHAILHGAKSIGKLAAVFEDLDHRKNPEPTAEQLKTIRDMAADLVTIGLRLANLHGFDLATVLRERVWEKNGVDLLDTGD